MGKSFGSRTLLAICGVLILLLAALAVEQYRWSTRVAAADAQREKEHLNAAAALFANEFTNAVTQANSFLLNDARAAVDSGQRLSKPPKLIGELYYLKHSAAEGPQVRRLTSEGVFEPAALPVWLNTAHCIGMAIEQPPTIVTPLYDVITKESQEEIGVRILKTFSQSSDRCFVARLDDAYLRATLLPQLIRQSFGATASEEYDFAVTRVSHPQEPLYGRPIQADVRKPFSMLPNKLAYLKSNASASANKTAIFFQHMETLVTKGGPPLPDVLGGGMWELEVAHKGVPLAMAFEQTRQRNLLLSLGVESLLIASIVFLVIGARRMQHLAEHKMRFIAGVSHELRTPVSAIAMLSRNQADGLVSGPERVKQYGELIHQQSRRLNEMVEQTLQYAGIHSGLRRLAKIEIDLRSLIDTAVDGRRDELARGGFEVEVALDPGLPAVPGDAELLRVAFDNLLSNAEKYAGAGHWIRVSAVYSAAGKEVLISVEDRGPGIDESDQAEIFEPFSRGRAAIDAQIPGSGLGLSLVRSAAEAHRGSVTLASEPGRGSIFTMHLPV